MATSTTRRPSAATLLAVLAASIVALTGTAASSAAAAPSVPASVTCSTQTSGGSPEGGVDMSATILGPDTSPCDQTSPSGSTGGSSTSSGGSSGPTRSSGTASGGASTSKPTDVETQTEPPAIGPAEVDLGGVLHVGGLSSSFRPSLNPLAGELELSFTVRNVSGSTIEADADFWMEGPFGNRISSVDDVAIAGLKPGESRTVSAELPGVGQWGILTAHATFTPPDVVEDTELSPLTRDATVFTLPWFVVLLIALGLGAWVVVQVVSRRPAVEPIGVLV